MLQYPGFNPVAFTVGPLQVHWYGIMYLAGFLVAAGLARFRASRPGSSWTVREVDDLIFYAMLGVLLGGRIGWLIFYGHEALEADSGAWYKVWQGGMSFHGGLVGVIFALALFARRHRRSIADVLDFTAPLPAIGLAAGRVGNFINGELWGKPTNMPWGFAVPQPNGSIHVLHATQLYEALLEGLFLFAIVWWFSSKPRMRWAVSGLFLVCYATFRIAVELLRVPDAQIGYLAGNWLTMGQLLSIPMFVAGVELLLVAHRRAEVSGNWRRIDEPTAASGATSTQ
jgi:phosphatidylglycerol:prolipoprotein diacylglycerol transferase